MGYGVGGFQHQIIIGIKGINDLSNPVKSAIGDLNKLKSVGDSMKSIGRSMVIGGVASAALFAAPVKSAVAFEAGMVEVAKTTNLAFSEIESGISDLADKGIPTSIDGLNSIAATAGQLGIKGKADIFGFTESVASIAAVSDLTADNAGVAFAQFSNVFDVPLTKISNMGSAVNELSNQTTATANDIVDAMVRIGRPVDSLRFDQMAGLAATIRDVGLGSERGGTAFRNVFVRMQTQAKDAAKVVGMSTQGWAKTVQQDGMGALFTLLEGLKKIAPEARATSIKDIFGEEAFLGVQKMVNDIDLLRKNVALASSSFDENVSLTKELKNVQDSAAGKITVLKNQFRLLTATIGAPLLDPLKSILERMTGVAKSIRDFSSAHPKLMRVVMSVAILGGVMTALGGIGIWMTGSMLGAVASIAKFGSIVKVGQAVKNMFQLVGFAMKSLFLNPVGLAIGAAVLLGIGLYQLYKRSETFRNGVNAIARSIRDTLEPVLIQVAYGVGFLVGVFEGAWAKIKGDTAGTLPIVGEALQNIADVLGPVLIPLLAYLKMSWVATWGAIGVLFKGTWQTVVATASFAITTLLSVFRIGWAIIGGTIKAFAQILTGDFSGAWGTISGMFVTGFEELRNIITGFNTWIGSIGEIFWSAGRGIITAMVDGIKAGWTDLKAGVIELFKKLDPLTPSSDARQGPLSNLTHRGRMFTRTFSSGVEDESDALTGAVSRTFNASMSVSPDFAVPPSRSGSVQNSRTVIMHNTFTIAGGGDPDVESIREKIVRLLEEAAEDSGAVVVPA